MRNDDLIYVGVGIGEYRQRKKLDHAVSDVTRVREALDDDGAWVCLNPTLTDVDAHLKGLKDAAGGSLFFHWSGHGEVDGDLVLIAPDAHDPKADDTRSAPDIVRRVLQFPATQQLYVFDVCHSGEAIDLAPLIQKILSGRQQGGPLWVGILTSCRDFEKAQDGAFGALLTRLLTDGPNDPELQSVEWSHHRRLIDGEALGHAVQKEWPEGLAQEPAFRRDGYRLPMIPNPRYREDASPVVVEHLLQAARSGADPGTPAAFVGRTLEVNMVTSWVTAKQPGVHLLTGPAGTGKSAILGRVLCLSNPIERLALGADDRALPHDDPGVNSIAAHVHARGLTVDQVAAALDEQLSGYGDDRILEPRTGGARNLQQLIGDLRQRADARCSLPCLVIDGLDEAGEHAAEVARTLVLAAQEWACFIVSSRDISTRDGSLLDELDPGQQRLDLGAGDGPQRTLHDVRSYLLHRLSGASDAMDADQVAELVIGRMEADEFGEPFLFARLLAGHLLQQPADTAEPGWEQRISSSYSQVFLGEIDRAQKPAHRDDLGGPALARCLMTALTWSFGRGFPMPEWLMAEALLSTEPAAPLDTEDLRWLLGHFGQFIVQDGEAGEAVYRLAHASLAELLRTPFTPSAEKPFDPAAEPVMKALLGRYEELLAGGATANAPSYLWRYVALHAASAGVVGIDRLRELCRLDERLKPDLATALLTVAAAAREVGRWQEAVAPTEEAVKLYRGLAEVNPAFVPDLAMALNNLGIRYSEVGRRQEAVAPTEESVKLRRGLAEVNPVFVPDLASALNNLGIRYSGVGRRQEAVAPTEEAVKLYRGLAEVSPAFVPDLASALNNLGVCYGEVGRRQEAVAPTEEAVKLRRGLAEVNPAFVPDLASALNNLGNRYSGVGRRQEAVAPTEEAVKLYRGLAEVNPVFVPDLAMALNNLGNHYSGVGRRQEAVAPTEEAVKLRRGLAEVNPVFVPNHAMALNNLGNRYSEVGRRQEAVAPTEEAVKLYRGLAEVNPAFVPDLAGALNNLGVRYGEVGRRQEAVAPTEEAVGLYRGLSEANPAFLSDLAGALDNLGNRYGDVNRPLSDVEAAWQSARQTLPMELHAWFVLERVRWASVNDQQVSAWLVESLSSADTDRVLARPLRDEARRRHLEDSDRWAAIWQSAAAVGAPGWLSMPAETLAAADAWVATPSYQAERDYLQKHLELLDEASDVAVEEALLAVSEEESDRLRELREAARANGVGAAYRPLLLAELAVRFIRADAGEQTELFNDNVTDLRSPEVIAVLRDTDDPAVQLAADLLDLDEDTVRVVLSATERPEELDQLLPALASHSDPLRLWVATQWVIHKDHTTPDVLFYLAVVMRRTDAPDDQVREVLAAARQQAPDRVQAWILETATLAAVDHRVAVIAGILAEPAPKDNADE